VIHRAFISVLTWSVRLRGGISRWYKWCSNKHGRANAMAQAEWISSPICLLRT